MDPTPSPDPRHHHTPTKAELVDRVADLAAQLEELEQRLGDVERERDEYLRDLQRVAADFDNFRKRAARVQESLVARAGERLMKELLPVLDDLERALEAVAGNDLPTTHHRTGSPPEPSKLEEGVRLVERQLRETLAREGLVEIETDGRFDPHIHEALLTQPSEAEEGAIVQVLQKGYRLGDRILRPARVVISQGVEEAQPAE
jgi:molecular chaperone GrpE